MPDTEEFLDHSGHNSHQNGVCVSQLPLLRRWYASCHAQGTKKRGVAFGRKTVSLGVGST